ncbi:hypothetical protein Tco_1199015 [Tanacetum coccineum]
MVDWLSIVETDKVIHTMKTDIVKLVVEIESFGMISDRLQPKQADLSCVHALNKLHLHEIHVVLSKHEIHKFAPLRRKGIQKLGVHLKLFQFHIVDVHVIE